MMKHRGGECKHWC